MSIDLDWIIIYNLSSILVFLVEKSEELAGRVHFSGRS
jgi:hypothetical protein